MKFIKLTAAVLIFSVAVACNSAKNNEAAPSGDDAAVAAAQGLHEVPEQVRPGGVAVGQNQNRAGTFVQIGDFVAVYVGELRGEGKFGELCDVHHGVGTGELRVFPSFPGNFPGQNLC